MRGRVAPLRRICRGGARSRVWRRSACSPRARSAQAARIIRQTAKRPRPRRARMRCARKGRGRSIRLSRGTTLIAPRSPDWERAAAFRGRMLARRPSARPTCRLRTANATFFGRPLQGLFSRARNPWAAHYPQVAGGQPRDTLPLRRGPEGSIARSVAVCQVLAVWGHLPLADRLGVRGDGWELVWRVGPPAGAPLSRAVSGLRCMW